MNPEEVIDLLTTAAAYDRRTVGDADVIAWSAAVGDLDFADARDAVVQHYRDSREWLMPADVRRLVKAMREARLSRYVLPAPAPELADDQRAYKEALERAIGQIADGHNIGRALTTGRGRPPTGDFVTARGEPQRQLRLAAQEVICPRCAAAVGERCVNPLGKPLGTQPAHEARLIAAGLAGPPAAPRPLSPSAIAAHPGLRLVKD
jgi:hypothetical protein